MSRFIVVILFFLTTVSFGQTQVKAIVLDATVIKADNIIAIDNFGTLYYTFNNSFYKKPKDKPSINYSNVQLGQPNTINVFNPLKINLFYQDFNTVIILDNRLAEIFKIDFNTIQPYKNISHISTGYDNTLWLFNQDLQQLELFDYKNNKTRATTVPVQTNVLDLQSDYNYCWLLTEKYLYQYTYFGSLLSKIENKGYTAIAVHDENIVLKSKKGLSYKSKNNDVIVPLEIPQLLINQFLLTNETLYIYDLEKLHKYQLKIN
ncbi:hypothetical protein ACU8DI_13465 [Psychroserpens sp. BH13MA-6]